MPAQSRPPESCSTLSTFGEFLTTKYELTFRSGRMCPAHARSSGSEALLHIRFLAGYTIDTHESSFQKRQG